MGEAIESANSSYDYSFSVWPDETWGFERAIYDLFATMGGRVEMTFTSTGFERFRSSLSHHGLTVREVERIPHFDPEPVL